MHVSSETGLWTLTTLVGCSNKQHQSWLCINPLILAASVTRCITSKLWIVAPDRWHGPIKDLNLEMLVRWLRVSYCCKAPLVAFDTAQSWFFRLSCRIARRHSLPTHCMQLKEYWHDLSTSKRTFFIFMVCTVDALSTPEPNNNYKIL